MRVRDVVISHVERKSDTSVIFNRLRQCMNIFPSLKSRFEECERVKQIFCFSLKRMECAQRHELLAARMWFNKANGFY